MKRSFFTLCLLICVTVSNAQTQWPEITQTARPWSRWWWQGSAVHEKDLKANMETYKAAGLGGLEITPIYGVQGREAGFVPYLSTRWMQLFSYTLKEARRLGLGIDMATGTGWPFGGGADITDSEACRNIVFKTYRLSAGQSLNEKIGFIQEPLLRRVENPDFPNITMDQLKDPITANPNLQALAADQLRFRKPLPLERLIAYSDQGESIDLTGKVNGNGELGWTAPGDNWTLYALFSGWHGKMVERAAPGGEGNVIDHFSEKALAKYLGRFDRAFQNADLGPLRSFFNDSYEVDDARGQSNWTPGFADEFRKRRGYDLKAYFPALFGQGQTEKDMRILYDYRKTISELLLERFTRPWQQWAAHKNKIVRNQSHGSPANILDLYAAVDIPETEGNEILRFKFASSAANVTGKKLVSAEAATWLDEHFQSTLSHVKLAVDKFFLGGVNHIFYHGTCYSPVNEPWPGWLFYAAVHFTPANPFWKHFGKLNEYVARTQSFLQQGKADNDVLLYFPFTDRNMEPGREMLHHYDGMNGFENTVFRSAAEEMLKKGFSFDLISDRQLQHSSVSNHDIVTEGNTYKTIVVAGAKFMELASFEKLVSAARSGARVIFYDRMPIAVPGWENLDMSQARFNEIKDSLEIDTDDSGRFGDEAISTSVIDNGVIFTGSDLNAMLRMGTAIKETMSSKGLSFVRRKYDKAHRYFIVNGSDSLFAGWISPGAGDPFVFLFDPMNKNAGAAFTRRAEDGQLQVYLELTPGESIIMETSSLKRGGPVFKYNEAAGEAELLQSGWKVHFDGKDQGLDTSLDLVELKSWTELENGKFSTFSGTAVYETIFKKPTRVCDAIKLDLGIVKHSAEIWLNDKKLETLIGPDFRLIIPVSLLKPGNRLRIIVANGMANRIVGLEKKAVKWKKFYNVNFPSWKKENRDEKGIFTAVNWQPEISGLLGPVTITPVNFIKSKK
jgi:hypothetical protein